MDRLVESGKTHGLEKAVAQVFPNLFTGKNGLKSGMLGRWKTQAEQQKWYEIPFERLPEADRHWRELPDWVRVPLGLEPRSLERFKDGKNIPSCISKKLVEMLEKSTTGSATSNLTSGKLDLKLVKKDAEELLATYHQTQEEMAKELGMEAPPAKLKVSDRWVGRLLAAYGWKAKTPNTHGAYLDFADERMERSRKTFRLQRAQQSVRLDMTLNFDQVWKATWEAPKKLWHRSFETEPMQATLTRKREKAQQELAALQRNRTPTWQVSKKRRITGLRGSSLSAASHCTYVCNCVNIIH